jgi:hypothetical protein
MVASVAVLRQLVLVMRSVKQTQGAGKPSLSTFRTPMDGVGCRRDLAGTVRDQC